MSQSKRGTYAWYELLTTDTAGATAFYKSVVGWDIAVWNPGPPPYHMLKAGEAGVGGLMELPEQARAMGAPPHWIAYIEVDDVDAAAGQIEKLGGRVLVPPMDVPNIGRWCTAADPHGAVFSAFKSANPDGMAPPSGVGTFCWAELMTPDTDGAWDFYAALFGWDKTESMEMGPAGTYQMFGAAGRKASLGGMMHKPAEIPGPAVWNYYIVVDDLTRALGATTAGGGQILTGPMQIPGGAWVAIAMDPQGAAFALLSETKS